ncbi:MAG: hypothetical protein K0U41_04840 [Gammaproteobacteria bacterium]|nr:hypothetical protein [Gammaproteobacteria bacterium]
MSVTANEVFDFMSISSNKRTDLEVAKVNRLILSQEKYLSQMLGRSLTSVQLTNEVLSVNIDYDVVDTYIRFIHLFTDMYEITALELGTTVIQPYDLDDEEGFVLDKTLGEIRFYGLYNIFTSYRATYSLTVTGKYGFVNQDDDTMREDVKQCIIEMVASKTNLWHNTSVDGGKTKHGYTQYVDSFIRNFKSRLI